VLSPWLQGLGSSCGAAVANDPMAEAIQVGDRVQVHLTPEVWMSEGWFNGTVVRIDRYTEHRSFFWVELDHDLPDLAGRGKPLISVLNPKNIRKI